MKIGRATQLAVGAGLLALLGLPASRHALELGMRPHMLAQYPLLMLSGALLGLAVPPRWRRALGDWNTLGLSGMTTVAVFMAVLMIPRVLDLVLVDARAELVKFGALLLAGALLRSSWHAAGRVMQAFFRGGMLPMMIVAGTVYQDAPLRLCNGYRLDEQQRLGEALICIAVAIAAAWLWRAGRELIADGEVQRA